MCNEKSKNLHAQWHAIKFCVKLKKMDTEMKEMLDAVCKKSVVSQASIYHRHNEFKSGRKSAKLMGEPGTPVA